jgi:hypothetical protein
MLFSLRHVFTGLMLVMIALPIDAADKPSFTSEQVTEFTNTIAPLLKVHCLKCHGDDPKKLRGEFDLRTREAVLRGGESGPAVVVGKPKESLLIQAIQHSKDGYAMPPTGKLKAEEIAVLTKWVQDGLAFPADQIQSTANHVLKKKTWTDEQKKYWAYQPVRRPEIPSTSHPIDALLAQKLDTKKLTALGSASKAMLIRRAYYDLHGLPPTPEQIDAFVNDPDPGAWVKLIDQLLASPRYGEKWGRHWLDLVRFAESNGYERDGAKPNAWRYRDYVIRSFNADIPYPQFIREQLAGDELPRAGQDQIDPIIATGYYRLGVWDDEPADPVQAKFDGYDDLVSITGQAFLGMTLNCARCHDHKGDPILQEDYYKMVAFLRDIRPYSNERNLRSTSTLTDITPAEKRKQYEVELTERQTKIDELAKKMKPIEDEAIRKMDPKDQLAVDDGKRDLVVRKVPQFLEGEIKTNYTKLSKEWVELRSRPMPYQEFALSVNNCEATPPPTFVNIRGNPHANGIEVQPGFPSIFDLPAPAISKPATGSKTSGRRTVLANWIASKSNPLTARVFMNRLWLHHFGKGLVPTANDFGKLGEQPTHHELLDWLAAEFMEPTQDQAADTQRSTAWTVKRMHRIVMTSQAYQRSSGGDAANLKIDPANTFLWRFNMRRLTAEELRDSMLSASGALNLSKLGGPSMYPKLSAEVLAGISFGDKKNHWPDSPLEEQNRRTVYAFVKRSIQVPILIQHDQADADNSCPVRYTTTVPTQALGMLNGDFTNEQARLLAARLLKEGDLAKQVARGIRLTTGRLPTADEVEKDVAFLNSLKTKHKLDDAATLQQYALLLLNTNEFVYLD